MIEVLRIERYVYTTTSRAEVPWACAERVDWSGRCAASTLLRAWHARSGQDEHGKPDGPYGEN